MAALALPAAEMGAGLVAEAAPMIAGQLAKTAVSAAATGGTLASAGYAGYKTAKKVHREVTGAYKDVSTIGHEASKAFGHITPETMKHHKKPVDLK